MKRILIFLIICVVLPLSCYDGEKLARVIIPLPSGIEKVHIAVFEDSITEENILINETVTTSAIDINVPTGSNRYFLIVAEDSDGYAYKCGITGPVDVNGSGSRIVISMETFYQTANQPDDVLDFNSGQDGYLRWNDVGATNYRVHLTSAVGGPASIYVDTGETNYLYVDVVPYSSLGVRKVLCEYEYFGISTEYSYPVN